MTQRRLLVALLLACLADSPALAGSNEGSQLAAVCASCHSNRPSQTGIPTLIGRSEVSIVQALRAYRSGQRVSQIMQVISASLSSGEIDVVAHAIAAKPPEAGR